jgi:hypothetical protein
MAGAQTRATTKTEHPGREGDLRDGRLGRQRPLPDSES